MINLPSLLLISALLLLCSGCSYRTGYAILNTTAADVTLSMTMLRDGDFELYTAPVDMVMEPEHWTRIDQWYKKDTTAEGNWKWGMMLTGSTALISPSTNQSIMEDGTNFPVTSLTLRGTSGTVYLTGQMVGAAFTEKPKGWYQFTYR